MNSKKEQKKKSIHLGKSVTNQDKSMKLQSPSLNGLFVQVAARYNLIITLM